MIHCRQKSVN